VLQNIFRQVCQNVVTRSIKCIIIDTNSNKQYKFTSIPNLLTYTYMSNIMNETDRFIKELIITIRDEKITQVINGY